MDEYIVKIYNKNIFNEGDYYFYKNGLLHREEGPAIMVQFSRDKFNSLKDKDLYKEETIPSKCPNDYEFKYLEDYTTITGISVARHYLDGMHYSKKEFENIKFRQDLKDELSSELVLTESNNTQKVKI